MDVILHCSDSKFGNAVLIDNWHREKGFNNGAGIHIGYHYVILNGQISATKYHNYFDGNIETGRPIDGDAAFENDETAAATLGKNNCVQIVLIGVTGQFTLAQCRSAGLLLKMLKEQFQGIKVYQHSDFDPVNRKFCAGISKTQMQVFNSL